jgi:hypothetical protein
MPAINVLDLPGDDNILKGMPVSPENAWVNSVLIIAVVCDEPRTTGEVICFLY